MLARPPLLTTTFFNLFIPSGSISVILLFGGGGNIAVIHRFLRTDILTCCYCCCCFFLAFDSFCISKSPLTSWKSIKSMFSPVKVKVETWFAPKVMTSALFPRKTTTNSTNAMTPLDSARLRQQNTQLTWKKVPGGVVAKLRISRKIVPTAVLPWR